MSANSGTCERCFMYQANLPRHMFIEYGVEVNDQVAAEVKRQDDNDKAHRQPTVQDEMVYMGNGPTQPK